MERFKRLDRAGQPSPLINVMPSRLGRNLKIILAPDSFKGSASAVELCAALARGIRRSCMEADILQLPMADGGEGTVTALVSATNGQIQTNTVVGPLGWPVPATWGILGDGETAVIEMAAASGLPLVPPAERNPMRTTTYGTGQLVLQALQQGCRTIILGIGGSATTDGGAGMAQALGYRFYRRNGQEITDYMNGELIGQVAAIDWQARSPLINSSSITVACDVENPLLGPNGAVMTYGPQKGARPEQLADLEENMTRFITHIEKNLGRSIRTIPGTGAAGGLGAGLLAFTHATIESGIRLVMETVKFQQKLIGTDLVVTGEGQVDDQTAFGKTISGILAATKPLHIPTVIVAGNIQGDLHHLYQRGATAVFSICPGPVSLEHAMAHSLVLAENAMDNILRLFRSGLHKH